MKNLYRKYNNLSKQVRDSFNLSITTIGIVSTIMSIIGFSINDLTKSVWLSILIIIAGCIFLFLLIYFLLGMIFKDEVRLNIRKTDVCITQGDIFKTPGWKVIGCDSHFDLRVDDIVISKKSLHGQLVLNHANVEELKDTIFKAASERDDVEYSSGQFTFPLGAIVPYESSIDGQKYLLLSMVDLDNQFEAHTTMAQYEQMLMKMWQEISRVYSLNNIVLPLLGTGIPRFDDGPKENSSLLRCMLCTLNSSGINLKSKVTIVLYGGTKKYKLYEYKDMFDSSNRRIE